MKSLSFGAAIFVFWAWAGCNKNDVAAVDSLEVVVPDWMPAQTALTREEATLILKAAVLRQPGLKMRGRTAPGSDGLKLKIHDISLEPVQGGPFCCWVGLTLGARYQEGLDGSEREGTFISKESDFKGAILLLAEKAGALVSYRFRASKKTRKELYGDLRSGDPLVREAAIESLVDQKDPAAAGPLVQQLKSLDSMEVRRAIGHLIEIKCQAAVPALIELTRGKNPVFLRELLFALGALGGEEAQAYLYTVAQGHDLPEIRGVAQAALQEMDTSLPKGEQIR